MRFVSLSFTQLIISVESHIYQLAYSRLVLYCVAHIFHPWSLGVLSVYSYVSLMSQTQLFCMHVYVLLPSFLAVQDSPGLSYTFPAPVLLRISLQGPLVLLFLLHSGITNHVLSLR